MNLYSLTKLLLKCCLTSFSLYAIFHCSSFRSILLHVLLTCSNVAFDPIASESLAPSSVNIWPQSDSHVTACCIRQTWSTTILQIPFVFVCMYIWDLIILFWFLVFLIVKMFFQIVLLCTLATLRNLLVCTFSFRNASAVSSWSTRAFTVCSCVCLVECACTNH